MRRWDAIVTAGAVEVPGLGNVSAVNRQSLAIGQDFDGSASDLEAMLSSWGSALLEFATAAAPHLPSD
jgi:hypothetical protein